MPKRMMDKKTGRWMTAMSRSSKATFVRPARRRRIRLMIKPVIQAVMKESTTMDTAVRTGDAIIFSKYSVACSMISKVLPVQPLAADPTANRPG